MTYFVPLSTLAFTNARLVRADHVVLEGKKHCVKQMYMFINQSAAAQEAS